MTGGVHGSRGVEYHVVMRDGARVVVISMRATDGRLVTTEYYAERRHSWLVDLYTRPRRIIGPLPIDSVQLTSEEKDAVDRAVADCGGGDVIGGHGWYDVIYLSSTL